MSFRPAGCGFQLFTFFYCSFCELYFADPTFFVGLDLIKWPHESFRWRGRGLSSFSKKNTQHHAYIFFLFCGFQAYNHMRAQQPNCTLKFMNVRNSRRISLNVCCEFEHGSPSFNSPQRRLEARLKKKILSKHSTDF